MRHTGQHHRNGVCHPLTYASPECVVDRSRLKKTAVIRIQPQTTGRVPHVTNIRSVLRGRAGWQTTVSEGFASAISQPLLELFADRLGSRQMKPSTIRHHLEALAKFWKWCGQHSIDSAAEVHSSLTTT